LYVIEQNVQASKVIIVPAVSTFEFRDQTAGAACFQGSIIEHRRISERTQCPVTPRKKMPDIADVVFMLDVDNTLLDNDHVHDDLDNFIAGEFGDATRARYWEIIETLRTELGYVDYLGALQRYRFEEARSHSLNIRLSSIAGFLLDYPFAERLYPGALDVLAYLRTFGPTIILSDGEIVYQPRKIHRAGLWQAVDGRVLIYIHKEQALDDVERRYPARHYVMVDDKLSILTAMKKNLGGRLTTVFARQGHYALDPHNLSTFPPADIAIEHIGDLIDCNFHSQKMA
jgi:FMN phosphatase YigB (HAD superfamily)